MHIVFCIAISICSFVGSTVYLNNPDGGWVDSISNNEVAAGSTSEVNKYFMCTPKTGNQFIGGVSPGNNVGGKAGVNNSGSFICWTVLNSSTKKHEASLYSVLTGTWTPLGDIGGLSGNSVSGGWNISGDGIVNVSDLLQIVGNWGLCA